jgi:type I restriction enzyme M protein
LSFCVDYKYTDYKSLLWISEKTKIAALIQQSFSLKATSEHLLETAKHAVEIAIETDEKTAPNYINAQIGT